MFGKHSDLLMYLFTLGPMAQLNNIPKVEPKGVHVGGQHVGQCGLEQVVLVACTERGQGVSLLCSALCAGAHMGEWWITGTKK